MTPYQETEVKLYVPDLAAVQARLEAQGAALTAPRVFERNVRYEDAAHSFASRGIVLRLRQDSRARLTYKDGGVAHDGLISRFEAEVEVSDYDAMATILERLGYTPQFIYEKYRTTYTLDGAEIVLDELPCGSFVEIEGDKHTIEGVMKRLELTTAKRYAGSYAALFAQVRARLRLSFNDLTFDNFVGVSVPESAITDPNGP